MSEISKIEPTTLAYLAEMIDSDANITINRSQRGRSVYHWPQIGRQAAGRLLGTGREWNEVPS